MTEQKQTACIFGEYCKLHGFIHGAEAEELRSRIETLIRDADTEMDEDKLDTFYRSVRRLLDDVDARDSVAYLEWKARHDAETWTGEWDSGASDDDFIAGEPWCKDFEGHKAMHVFCDDHQAMWCRVCDRGCVKCVDDPHCADCGCSLFTEEHDWDCAYAGEDDDE